MMVFGLVLDLDVQFGLVTEEVKWIGDVGGILRAAVMAIQALTIPCYNSQDQ